VLTGYWLWCYALSCLGLPTPAAASWDSYSSQGFLGAMVLAIISFVVYFIFTIILIVLQAAISEHLGISEPPASLASVMLTEVLMCPGTP
jgi:hypothetical protein